LSVSARKQIDAAKQRGVLHSRPSEPAPTAREESNGLGLVKHFVESQNGTVGADFPASGGSSIFWCEIPVA